MGNQEDRPYNIAIAIIAVAFLLMCFSSHSSWVADNEGLSLLQEHQK